MCLDGIHFKYILYTDMSDIKHLVISGGGIIGFSIYTALKKSHQQGLWNIQQIESIYATSIGTIIAVILCLQYDWETTDEYLLNRPWKSIFNLDISSLLSSLDNRGLFDQSHFEQILDPLFRGKDLSLNITIEEFYRWSNIELHFFASELNEGFSKDVDFSYKTHPEWRLLDAMYCSCSLPILFRPFLKETSCFIDGGIFLNYPLPQCLQQIGENNKHQVLGFKRNVEKYITNVKVTDDSSLLDSLMAILSKTMERILQDNKPIYIPNEIIIHCSPLSFPELFRVIELPEERKRLFDKGEECWNDFLQTKQMSVVAQSEQPSPQPDPIQAL